MQELGVLSFWRYIKAQGRQYCAIDTASSALTRPGAFGQVYFFSEQTRPNDCVLVLRVQTLEEGCKEASLLLYLRSPDFRIKAPFFPVLVCTILDQHCRSYLSYCGPTLGTLLATKEISDREFLAILFQLTWAVLALELEFGVEHTDLDYRDVCVKTLSSPMILTFVASDYRWKMETKHFISITNLSNTVKKEVPKTLFLPVGQLNTLLEWITSTNTCGKRAIATKVGLLSARPSFHAFAEEPFSKFMEYGGNDLELDMYRDYTVSASLDQAVVEPLISKTTTESTSALPSSLSSQTDTIALHPHQAVSVPSLLATLRIYILFLFLFFYFYFFITILIFYF